MEFLSEKLGYLTGFISAYMFFTLILFFVISAKVSATFPVIAMYTSIITLLGFAAKRAIS